METATVLSTVKLIDDYGNVTDYVFSLPPKEALQQAVNQVAFGNFKTWDPIPVEPIETPVGYTYICGQNQTFWVRK